MANNLRKIRVTILALHNTYSRLTWAECHQLARHPHWVML